jgi:hypothetical protein
MRLVFTRIMALKALVQLQQLLPGVSTSAFGHDINLLEVGTSWQRSRAAPSAFQSNQSNSCEDVCSRKALVSANMPDESLGMFDLVYELLACDVIWHRLQFQRMPERDESRENLVCSPTSGSECL